MLSYILTYYPFVITCPIASEPERYCQEVNQEQFSFSLTCHSCHLRAHQGIKREKFQAAKCSLDREAEQSKQRKRLKFPYRYCPKAYNRLPLERGQNKT
jgi:hypothetical protein